MTHPSKHTCVRFWPAILLVTLLLLPSERASAQVLPAAAGAVGGFLAGTFVSTGAVVLEARLGNYIYGIDDFLTLRPEIVPMVVGPITGIVLGAVAPETLKRVGQGALVGVAGGAIIGSGVGQLLWSSSEGRWAGGIIGGAAGLIVGAVVNGARKPAQDGGQPVATAAFSLKVPWGGGRR